MTLNDELVSTVVDESFIFRSLDEGVRMTLKSEAIVRTYAAGDTLIREHEEGTEMMIVVGGMVEVSQRSPQGDVSLAGLGKGAVIGEVSVITGTPRTSTVTAKADVTVLCFSKDTIQSIVSSTPKVKKLLLKLIEGRALQSMGISE